MSILYGLKRGASVPTWVRGKSNDGDDDKAEYIVAFEDEAAANEHGRPGDRVEAIRSPEDSQAMLHWQLDWKQ